MITLHHLEYSQSFRVLWLLEELAIKYELIKYRRDPKTNLAPPEYKAISPLGTAPLIKYEGQILAESNAIIDFVLDLVPEQSLRPPAHAPNRSRYLFWFHAAQGSMMPIMLMDGVFRIVKRRLPFLLRPVFAPILDTALSRFAKPRMAAILIQAEEALNQSLWFAGDELTAADISLCYPMEAALARGYITDEHPRCKAWLERVYSRPSFIAALEKDGRPRMVLPL